MTPAPWVNVLANPSFGTLVSESGSANDLERERAGVSSHAVVERPGRRCEHRGVLHPRRGKRPLLVAHAAAEWRRGAVCDAAWLRLQRVRTQRGRHRLRTHRVRGNRRAGQVRRVEAAQWVGTRTPAFRHRLPGMGARRRARRKRACTSAPRSMRAAARCSRATRTTPTSPGASHSSRSTMSRTKACVAIAASSSGATARCAIPPRCRRRGCPAPWVPRWIRVPPSECHSSWPTARRARSSFASAPEGAPRRRANSLQRWRGSAAAHDALAAVKQYWQHTLGAVQVETPDRSLDVLGQRLARLPGPGVPALGPHRVLSIERRVRLSRSIAGRDGARPRRAGAGARAPAALRVAPVSRRRCPALVASAVGARRAHALFGRLSVAAAGDVPLRRGHRRHWRARRAGPFPGRPRAQGRGRVVLRSAQAVRPSGQPLRALRARHRARSALWSARLAADGLGRLERRHEPRRRRRQGRKRLARLLSVSPC